MSIRPTAVAQFTNKTLEDSSDASRIADGEARRAKRKPSSSGVEIVPSVSYGGYQRSGIWRTEHVSGDGSGGDDVREISALLECAGMGVDEAGFMEVFCLGRVREFGSLFGVVHGGALDSRSGWNLSDEIEQWKCLQMVNDTKAPFVLGLGEVCSVLPVGEPKRGVGQVPRHRALEIRYKDFSNSCDRR